MPAIQTPEIKNIIFDWGGVLLNINPLLSLEEFETICGISKEDLINKFLSARVFEKFDTGYLKPEQFRDEICQILGLKVKDAEIDRIWNKLLLDFPSHRIELLRQLRKNYTIYLLSNTNAIHYEFYTEEFYRTYGFPMTDLFDRLFLSYEIGIHKPDEGVYTYVLQAANIKASETIFFDDSKANIEAAIQLGIKGIQITEDNEITHFFKEGLIK
jgi:glucose-1-phosphatase